MSFEPVVPPLLLIALAVMVIGVALLRFRRLAQTSGAGRREALWRWGGLTAAALLLIAAAARPVFGAQETVTQTAGADAPNVFLVVDRSAGMDTGDGGRSRSRLEAARDDVGAVIDRYPDARFAVISFADKPSMDWPLSADAFSLRPVIAAATPVPPTPDDAITTNAGAAANVLRYQLIGATQQYPRAPNLVFYFGAGAGGSRSPQREFDLPAVDGGAVLGYGSAAAIDEPALGTVAAQIGVPYVHRDGVAPLDVALPAADVGRGAQPVTAAPPRRTETYWGFAIGAAGLLLVELYLVLREFRRTRMVNADVIV